MDFASEYLGNISKQESPEPFDADEAVIRQLMGEVVSKPKPAAAKPVTTSASTSISVNPKVSGASFGAKAAQFFLDGYGATDTAQFVPTLSVALQKLSFDQMKVLFLACKDMSIGLDFEENNNRILENAAQPRANVNEPTKTKPYRQKAEWAAALIEIVPILRKSNVPAQYISWGLLAQTPEFITTSKIIVEKMFIHSHILGEQPLYSKMFFSTMNLRSFKAIISPRAVFSYSVVRILTILGVKGTFVDNKTSIDFSGMTEAALNAMKEGFRGDSLMLDGKRMVMNENLLKGVKEAISNVGWDIGKIPSSVFKSLGVLIRNCVNVRPHMVQQVPEDRKTITTNSVKIEILVECVRLYNLMLVSTFPGSSDEFKVKSRFPDLRKEEGNDYHDGWKKYVGTVRALKAELGEERRGAITRGSDYYSRDLAVDELVGMLEQDMF